MHMHHLRGLLALACSVVPLLFTGLVVLAWMVPAQARELSVDGEAGSPFAIFVLLGLLSFFLWAASLRLAQDVRHDSGNWTSPALLAMFTSGFVSLVWIVVGLSGVIRLLLS